MVRVVPANRVARRLVVLGNAVLQELNVVASFVGIGELRFWPPILCAGQFVEGFKTGGIGSIEIIDAVAVQVAHDFDVSLYLIVGA